jgi:DNA-binding CsgD family transcriptional regulator
MPFPAQVLKVLLASPDDTLTERDVIEKTLQNWNGDHGESSGVIFLPVRWDNDAEPNVPGRDVQSVINAQLLDDVDLVFGVFHARLGYAMPRAASDTAEEILRSRRGGKPVHLYFCERDIPRNDDRDQLAALDSFKEQLHHQGLLSRFRELPELADKVRRALDQDVRSWRSGGPASPTRSTSPQFVPREVEWLKALASGGTVAALAQANEFSEREMYRLIGALYSKLGASNRSEAVALAKQRGLIG